MVSLDIWNLIGVDVKIGSTRDADVRFEISNKPESILSAWIALEALSPQSYKRPEDMASGDKTRVVMFDECAPWFLPLPTKPKNHHLYFEVILGSVRLDNATDELVAVFGDDDEKSRPDGARAAIGSIMVDEFGFLLPGKEAEACAISSFAWAINRALKCELEELAAWPEVEGDVIEAIANIFRRTDKDGNPIPIDLDLINKAHEWIVSTFDIPKHLVEPPSFSLKVFHHLNSKTPPELSLLNSFYLSDLSLALKLTKSAKAQAGLLRYLGVGSPSTKVDVLEPANSISSFVSPSQMPQARWPSPGGHPLVLLQQAAVNAARAELGDASGIIGINGPPGTGKTTLLRDIVAGCVLDRAIAMAGFSNPEDAFTNTKIQMRFGSSSYLNFHSLHPSLKGHEIVVASSNNKAVENVSRELPLKEANGRQDSISYFRSISDLLSDSCRSGEGPTVETWGLIAAALGNGRNRSAFQQAFWWHDERGFQTYLKAARGLKVSRTIKGEKKEEAVDSVPPEVVRRESPSSNKMDAEKAWKSAREEFLKLKSDVDAKIQEIEVMRRNIAALRRANLELDRLRSSRVQIDRAVSQAGENCERCSKEAENAKFEFNRVVFLLDTHRSGRPGIFSRLFGTPTWKSWSATQRDISDKLQRSSLKEQAAIKASDDAKDESCRAAKGLERCDGDILKKETEAAYLQGLFSEAKTRLGNRIIDDVFFDQEHEAIHLTSPWLTDEVHHMREDLFAAALKVHKAFIDVCAAPLQHNLGILMKAMTAGALKSTEQRELLPDLWSSLFMVVPVISTTFASVQNMFGDLPVESYGWLLIDEAGQAIPQAAVGAIMRAKRSIVVGDPMQIPPVVSLPESLSSKICKFFRISDVRWSAPSASTQTLADAASRFSSTFATDSGEREVGFPLLVHRRCQNPMFNISNDIAYAGQMVHAASLKNPGAIGAVLGQSRWINVVGSAETKWCPEEGEEVVRLLKKIAEGGVVDPDLFVITPFKIVEQEMRRRLAKEAALLQRLGVSAHTWGRERVGTIHTFQGREADTVILLLGASKESQNRARNWAADPPNIINVAASRAKQNLYVVGSEKAWAGAGTSIQRLQRYMCVPEAAAEIQSEGY